VIKQAMVGLAVLACPINDQAERPVCTPTLVEGRDVVTFMVDDEITCDVRPPMELNIVFDAAYAEAWGGDLSVERAAAECDDMGGRQVWVQDPYRLICEDVDY